MLAAVTDCPDPRSGCSRRTHVPPVWADAAHLERALANLLENAARYSGGLPVSVNARRSGSHVVVRVVDQGPLDSAERALVLKIRARSAESMPGPRSTTRTTTCDPLRRTFTDTGRPPE